MIAVDIQDVIDSIRMQSDFVHLLFDKDTYGFIEITDDNEVFGDGFNGLDFEEAMDIIESDDKRFIPLPSSFEVNAYGMIEDFITTLDRDMQEEFYIVIRGKGAFRRFKDLAFLKGVIDEWYDFEYAAIKDIAIAWCDRNQIAYIETSPISKD